MKRHKLPFVSGANVTKNMDFSSTDLGQHCPQPNPHSNYGQPDVGGGESLGDPMDIETTAKFLGCSVWTVRQRYLSQGLPHLRASAEGKLIFFRRQVVDWILKRQQK